MKEFFSNASSWALTWSFIFGTFAIVLANGAYPYLKEKEDAKEKLSKENSAQAEKKEYIKQMLADEIMRNIRFVISNLKHLKAGSIKISPISTSALDSVIISDLIRSLEPKLYSELLNLSYSMNQAKRLHEILSQIMISESKVAHEQRKSIENELDTYLRAAKVQLVKIFKEFELEKKVSYPEEVPSLYSEIEEKI